MGTLGSNNCCASARFGGEANLDPATFDIPNHILIAGHEYQTAKPLIDTAQRRGWVASVCSSFADLQSRVTLIPPGGVLLLDTSILSDRSGIERLTQLGELVSPPKIYLITLELGLGAVPVREICMAAHIPIQDILVLPLSQETLDRMLGA